MSSQDALIELRDYVTLWALTHPFTPIHVDCSTTVMLKILDGKCKMSPESKVVMALLYEAIKSQQGAFLPTDIHTLIADSRDELSDQQRMEIYEKRLLAETMISRPIMKGFKAMIKKEGLFDSPAMAELELTE